MKYLYSIILYVALFLCSLSCNAQTTFKLKDLINRLENRASSNNVSMDVEAIMPELSIIRQQYRLERNGEFFGKNNNSFYGETYSLAVKVSGGMLFLGDVMEPWRYDADYQRANASGRYKTELFWTYQRSISDSVWKAVDLELGTQYVTPMNAGKSLYMYSDAHRDFGLSIDNTVGKKDGYMIWAYSKTTVQDSSMVVELRQSSYSVNVNHDSTLIKMEPTDSAKIIGGLYVMPKYERGGRIQYILTGVAVKNGEQDWRLQLFATEENGITKSEEIVEKPGNMRKPEKKKKR